MVESILNKHALYADLAKTIQGRTLSGSMGIGNLIKPTIYVKLIGSPELHGMLSSTITSRTLEVGKACNSVTTYDSIGISQQLQNDYATNPASDYATKLQLITQFPQSIHAFSFNPDTPLHIHATSWSNSSYWSQVNISDSRNIPDSMPDIASMIIADSRNGHIDNTSMRDIFTYNSLQEFDPDALLESDPDLKHLREGFLSDFINLLTESTYAHEKFPMLPEIVKEAMSSVNEDYMSDLTEQAPTIIKHLTSKWAVSTEFTDFKEFAESLEDLEPGSMVRLTILKPTPLIEGIEGVPFLVTESTTAFLSNDGDLGFPDAPETILITLPTIEKARSIQ